MQIEHLREFIVTANMSSFGLAAKALFVSPSTVSKHISQMEQELGVKLFVRERTRVDLTDAGAAFLDGAKRIMAAYENALSMIEATKQPYDQLITVGFMRRATNAQAAALKKRLRRQNPRLEVQLLAFEYPVLLESLFQRIVDVAIVMNVDPMLAGSCKSHMLTMGTRCLAVNSKHKWAKRDCITTDLICTEPLILPNPSTEPDTFRRITELLPEYKSAPNISYYRDIDSLILAVAGGDGVAIIPQIAEPYLDEGLVLLPIEDVDTSYAVSALWMNDLDGKTESFLLSALE